MGSRKGEGKGENPLHYKFMAMPLCVHIECGMSHVNCLNQVDSLCRFRKVMKRLRLDTEQFICSLY